MKLLATKGLCMGLLFLTGCGGGGGDAPFTFSGGVESLVGGSGSSSSGAVMAGDDTFAPLRPLLGTVNFSYLFLTNPDANMFSDTVVYTSDNFILSDSGVPGLVASDVDGGNTACVAIDRPETPYLCVSVDTSGSSEGSLDYFLFSEITNGTASGNYEFCSGLSTECDTGELVAMQLVQTPDGTVNVTVTPFLASAGETGDVPVATARFREANQREFKLYYESILPAVEQGVISTSGISPEIDRAMGVAIDILRKNED
ncbi:MAG: hypothetical protein AB8B64_02230 [Granulosicoccus sp.]